MQTQTPSQVGGGGAVLALAGLVGLGLGAGLYFLILALEPEPGPGEPVWEVGDVIWCDCGGDPGLFTIMGRVDLPDGFSYHVGEGFPVIGDLGWWTESQLLNAPWLCSI